MELKLFIGTVKESRTKGVCSMNLWCARKFMSLPIRVYTYGQGITHHRLVLLAILDFLDISDKPNVNLTVYTDNDRVVFEWEKEYSVDKEFCTSTHDLDLWEAIASRVRSQNIKLTIKGQSDALTGISRIERNKLG